MQGIDDDGDTENAIDATTTGAGTSAAAAAAAARAVRSSRGRPQECGGNATRQREEKRARPPSPYSTAVCNTVAPIALRGAPGGVPGVEGSSGDEDDATSEKAAPAVPTASVAATTTIATTPTTATATAAATAMNVVTATATVETPTTMAMGYEGGGISKGPFAPLVPLTPLVPLGGKDGAPAANPASNTIDFSAHSTHLTGSAERVEHKRARTDNATAGRDTATTTTTSTAANWVKVHRAGGPPTRVVVPSGRAAGAVLREGYFPGQAPQQTTEEPAAGTGGKGEDGGWEIL